MISSYRDHPCFYKKNYNWPKSSSRSYCNNGSKLRDQHFLQLILCPLPSAYFSSVRHLFRRFKITVDAQDNSIVSSHQYFSANSNSTIDFQ